MISIARIFGAPVSVPAGKHAARRVARRSCPPRACRGPRRRGAARASTSRPSRSAGRGRCRSRRRARGRCAPDRPSITCSARSFGSASSRAGRARGLRRASRRAGGAGDRPRLDLAAPAAHEHLRRGAEDRRLARLEVEEVRRRVQHPQRAVDVERVHVERRRPALREDDLVDVAGEDRLPGASRPPRGTSPSAGRAKTGSSLRGRGARRRLATRRRPRAGSDRRRRNLSSRSRRAIAASPPLPIAPPRHFEVGQEQEALPRMVERDDGLEEEEEAVGDPPSRGWRSGMSSKSRTAS